jgi:hypothetical protein
MATSSNLASCWPGTWFRLLALSSCAWSGACLPEDTRRTPGSVITAVTADAASGPEGFVTSDGWHVTYRSFLVVLGEIELDGDDCDPYSERGYSRILDMTRPEPQRVSIAHGLGTCDFSFRVTVPRWNTILGEGVPEDAAIALRTPGSDAHAHAEGISVFLEGTAERLDPRGAQPLSVRKRFAWPFRRFIEYEDCAFTPPDGTEERGVTLTASRSTPIDLFVRGDVFFVTGPAPSDPSRPDVLTTAFEPFRAADDEHGDADGDVTLDELERTPWTDLLTTDPSSEAETLGAHVYLYRLPELVRYRGGSDCKVRASAEEPDDGGPF